MLSRNGQYIFFSLKNFGNKRVFELNKHLFLFLVKKWMYDFSIGEQKVSGSVLFSAFYRQFKVKSLEK